MGPTHARRLAGVSTFVSTRHPFGTNHPWLRVIDADVHVLPADDFADSALGVGALAGVVPALAVGDPLASAALDPSELLDVDVDQLARASSLVPLRGLQAEPAELA